jgi:hypothetical protein
MKKFFSILVLVFCASNLFAQKKLYNDIVYPDGETKGTTSITYWNKSHLYYYLHNSGGGLTYSQCQTAIQNAFNTWSQYSNFTFTQTSDISQADIKISWEQDNHSGCTPFDSDDLAHSTIGKTNGNPPSFIHFRTSETFTMTSSPYSLEAVALHEIGHVLGLVHSPNSNSVMYEYYDYKTDLTGYDLSNFYSHYTFPWSLTGPNLIIQNASYNIHGLNSSFTTSWILDDPYYSTHNCLGYSSSTPGVCVITRDPNQDMMDAELTAIVLKNGIEVKRLTKSNLYAYSGFWGQYTSGNISGNINYTYFFNIKANNFTTIFSPNFYGATVSYSSSGAIPSSWSHNSNTGVVSFYTTNTSTPVIINVHDGCNNDYVLYAYPSSLYSMNVFSGASNITVTLVQNGDSSKDFTPDQSWTIEIINAATGRVMNTLSSASRSEIISTIGWPKGIYIVKATIGEEKLTEKVIVK